MDLNAIAHCLSNTMPNRFSNKFNQTLLDFLDNLKNTFPGYELELTVQINSIHLAVSVGQSTLPIKVFWQAMGDEGFDKCVARDQDFMLHQFASMEALKDFDIQTLWHECPPEVQENIWLYMIELATTAKEFANAKDGFMHRLGEIDQQVDTLMNQGASPHEIITKMLSAMKAQKK